MAGGNNNGGGFPPYNPTGSMAWNGQQTPGFNIGPVNSSVVPNYPAQSAQQGGIPGTPPVGAKVGLWEQPVVPLTWVNGTDPVVRTAVWSTPLFDFRPDLGAGASSSAYVSAQPIWSLRSGGRLWIQIYNLTSPLMSASLRLTYKEFGSVIYTNGLGGQGTAPGFAPNTVDAVDITTEIASNGRDSVILPFVPTGDGYPVKYWRLQLTFDMLAAVDDPPLRLMAAVY